MKQTNNLSFLDVMACGLGSILFLFFVFTAIKEKISFDCFTESSSKLKIETTPLVIFVNSISTAENSQIPFIKDWLIPEEYNCKKQNTPFFAVLFANAIPKIGQEIWLTVSNHQMPISVQIFNGGKSQFSYNGVYANDFPSHCQSDKFRFWPTPVRKE